MLIESFETWQAHEDVAVGCGGHLASDMYDEDAPNPIVTWNKNPHFIIIITLYILDTLDFLIMACLVQVGIVTNHLLHHHAGSGLMEVA